MPHRSIRQQLFFMFAAPFAAAVLICAAILWSTWEQRLRVERASNVEMARAIETAFLSFVDGLRGEEATLGKAILALERREDAGPLLEEAAAGRAGRVAFAWVTPEGTVVAASDREMVGTSVAWRPEFVQVARGARRALGNLVRSGTEEEVSFGFARGVRARDGALAGVVLAVVDPDRLDERVLGTSRVGNAGFALVDAAGRLVMRAPRVSRSWAERDVSQVELVRRALAGEEASGPTRSMANGEPWIGAAVPIGRLGWVARAGRSQAEIEGPIRADALRAAAWAALAALGAAFASAAIGRRIAGSVTRLEQHAIALGHGEPARRAVGGPEEIERLGRAFDEMAGSLLAANEAARRAVRHRDEMLAVVSHDLRTPLGTVVAGAAALARSAERGRVEPAAVLATAGRIRSASERMRRMADDLLDLASLDEGRLAMTRTACAPAALLRDAVEQVHELARARRLEVAWEADPDLPAVRCDAGRIQQVLGNLLSNAVKASEDGRVVARAVAGASMVRFEVEDAGRGIPEEELPTIFDRFRRGRDAEYRGAGLGLAIARGIVEAHGGTIRAESRVGEGTRMLFTLPVAADGARGDAARPVRDGAAAPS